MAIFTDLSLLFVPNPRTKDVVKLEDEEAIKFSVKNLILTKNYEKPFHPEIGCQVNAMLFENFSPTVENVIKQTISDVITKFEPRVTMQDVRIRNREEINELEVEVYFKINSTDKLVAISVAINRLR
jgi:phage baseplate assembly protein W